VNQVAQQTEPAATTLAALTREQLAERLADAARLAVDRLPRELPRLREMLADLLARTDSLELVQTLDRRCGALQPAAQLRCAALSVAGGEPVGEWLLIPFGEVFIEQPGSPRSFVFTRRHADSAKVWFDRIGRKLAIDYEHQSLDRFSHRPDGLRPAAGWIGGLEVREDGLWAVGVTWTVRARELLHSGEYRYFSPVIYWTDEDCSDIAALGPVALTNDPAMRGVTPLAASRQGGTSTDPPSAEPEEDEDDLAEELEDARDEIETLRRRLRLQEADAFVERGLRLGKIVDSSSMDWRADFLRDAAAAEERLSRTPVLLPPGRVLPRDPATGRPVERPTVRSTAQSETLSRLSLEPADLEAYERACAAGRVRRAGAQ